MMITVQPSVLAPALEILTTPSPGDGFESIVPSEGSSPSRRQRISMACQYCRHRKIRCCGGSPCRNCARSARECEYAPVPEEVNRATREKKATAKIHKTVHSLNTPGSLYSPFLPDSPAFDVPYYASPMMPGRPGGYFGHRRSVSSPQLDGTFAHLSIHPHTPLMPSPALAESTHWMYGPEYAVPLTPLMAQPTHLMPALAPHTPHGAFPSVLEQTPMHEAYLAAQTQHPVPVTPPDSRSGSAEAEVSLPMAPPSLPTSYSTPNLAAAGYLRPALNVITPTSPSAASPANSSFYSPYATPPVYTHATMPMYSPSPLSALAAHSTDISPTLAPEMGSKEQLVGLGLGADFNMYTSPVLYTEEYFTTPSF